MAACVAVSGTVMRAMGAQQAVNGKNMNYNPNKIYAGPNP
jgi:hypothetical protein